MPILKPLSSLQASHFPASLGVSQWLAVASLAPVAQYVTTTVTHQVMSHPIR